MSGTFNGHNRVRDRADFTPEVRLRLIESDFDTITTQLDDTFKAIREEFSTAVGEIRKEVAAVRRVLIGILVSVTTAAILLAINLGVAK